MLNDFKYILVFVYKICRHSGVNVKDEYDKVVKFYDLKHNVFKVITDQAANMRKAFGNEKEAHDTDEINKLTNELLLNQITLDKKTKQDILRVELEEEILEFSTVEKRNQTENIVVSKKNRDQILASLLDDSDEDITDTLDDLNASNDTLNDADELENDNVDSLMNEFLLDDEISNWFYFNFIFYLILIYFLRISVHTLSSSLHSTRN